MASDLMIEVDENGNADFSDLAEWWKKYRDLLQEAAEIDVKIQAVKKRLEDRMEKAGATGFTINGVPVVSYKKDATFAAARFVKENPHVAEQYMVTKRVLDTTTLQRHRPEEYARYQGHRFVVLGKGN